MGRSLDTNVVDAIDDASTDLMRLHHLGWIQLQRTDTMDTELQEAATDDKRASLLARSAPLIESFGPLIIGHSRLGLAFLGGQPDDDRLSRVAITLYGREMTKLAKNDARDVMHVHTAIRYAAFGLVTHDKRMLRRADRIKAEFGGFRLLSAASALVEALDRVRRLRIVNAARAIPTVLPEWPPEAPRHPAGPLPATH